MNQVTCFIFFILSLNSCIANEFADELTDTIILNSNEAIYDGKSIHLAGDVEIEHHLGVLTANRIQIESVQLKEKKLPFSTLELESDVKINLIDKGVFTCQYAKIDYYQRQGVFCGDAKKLFVTYKKDLLKIKSCELTVKLTQETASSKDVYVETIVAEDSVKVNYLNYKLMADEMIYQRLSSVDTKIPHGTIELNSKNSRLNCHLRSEKGDDILAEKMVINTLKETILLSSVKGSLFVSESNDHDRLLFFKCDKMFLDHIHRTIHLEGNIELEYDQLLLIQTDRTMIINFESGEKIDHLKTIHVPHAVEIKWAEPRSLIHSISCQGPFTIDHEQQLIAFEKENAEEHQIFLKGSEFDLYCDELKANYQIQNNEFLPTHLVVQGNVCLYKKMKTEEKFIYTHTITADQIIANPQTKEMRILSSSPHQVILFDQTKRMQMQANELRVTMNSITKKEEIKGIGKVSLIFNEPNVEKIRTKFRLSDANEEN